MAPERNHSTASSNGGEGKRWWENPLVVALVSIIAGGLLGGGFSVYNQGQIQAHDTEEAAKAAQLQIDMEAKEHRRELRQAVNLVDGELEQITNYLNLLVLKITVPENLRKLGGETRFLPTAIWDEYKDNLAEAEGVSDELFRRLYSQYEEIEAVRFILLSSEPGTKLGKVELPPNDLTAICAIIRAIRTELPDVQRTGELTGCLARG